MIVGFFLLFRDFFYSFLEIWFLIQIQYQILNKFETRMTLILIFIKDPIDLSVYFSNF
jgi:hypothetical protein